jgi:GAF domain-containing protein
MQIRVGGRWIAGEAVSDRRQVPGEGVLVSHHGHLLWVDPEDVRTSAEPNQVGPSASAADLWSERTEGLDAGIAAEFARMALELHDEPGVDETIEKVLEFALRAVACDAAAVLLVHKGGKVEVAAATDHLATDAAEAQVTCGEGPGLAALDLPAGLMIRDAALDQRWPEWAARFGALGLRSVLSVRLSAGGSNLGTLELYDAEPARFDADDEAVAQILSRHASVALSQARQESTLWQAIDARKLIGQAQGLLMERFDLDADQAFAVLRRYSQDNNVKLREVARLLVETRRLPTKD